VDSFAGLTLNGAVIEQGGDATRASTPAAIPQGNVSATNGSEPFLAMRKFAAGGCQGG